MNLRTNLKKWLLKNKFKNIEEAYLEYDKIRPFHYIQKPKFFKIAKELELPESKEEKESCSVAKVVQINDVHVPFHDKQSVNAFLKFYEDFKPDKLVIAGDFFDFYELSKFDKNPERRKSLQEELTEGIELLGEFLRLSPKTQVHFIKGNHEDRLRRYLWRFPELSSLDELDFASLASLRRMGIEYHEESFVFNKFIFTHGFKCSKHSSYTAKAELEEHGTSGSSGHTHRMGRFLKTDYRGTIGWFENGCLCDLQPEYMKGKIANWQQCFSVIYFQDDRFHYEQVPIINHEFLYGGKLYK